MNTKVFLSVKALAVIFLGLMFPRLLLGQEKVPEFFVDYDMTLEQMIVAGRYDLINPDITTREFPLAGIGKVAFEPKLFQFDYKLSSVDVIREMEKEGFRPAKIEELLAYGAINPEEQWKYPIVALGYNLKTFADPVLGAIVSNSSWRFLGLTRWDEWGWNVDFRFLGVRK